ncbi:MAG: hydroxymethylbilane synthase [Thermomicrobiales bacterium]
MSMVGMGREAIVIGTRGSKLALAQTELVRAALLARYPALTISVARITTQGDAVIDRPLAAIGGKGLFVTEIEAALRDGRIDLAVHSAKDLPSTLPDDLTIAAIPARADARDVLVARDGAVLRDLPPRACVGTSSPRRACQLRALRPDLTIADVRGNVDTRLRKLAEGQYDAIALAAAGLARLALTGVISEWFAPETMVPAIGQGALAIETRADDADLAALLAPLHDADTAAAVTAERAFLAELGGGCTAAVAAHATIAGDTLTLAGLIGAPDGRLVRDTRASAVVDAARLGATLAASLLAAGGVVLLSEAGDD